ncbi:hypothetical protein ES708_22046 [subsurface metagenome]
MDNGFMGKTRSELLDSHGWVFYFAKLIDVASLPGFFREAPFTQPGSRE